VSARTIAAALTPLQDGGDALDEAAFGQVVEDPVRRRRMQPGAGAELLQRDGIGVRGQHVEQRIGACEYLDRRSGAV
jgi:hypothetical protein